MDPLESWVDADEVRRLAARLMEPVRPVSVAVAGEMAGFSEDFVGFADTAPVPAKIETTTPPAAPPPPPAAPEQAFGRSASATPPAQSASGRFLENIRRFRDWMSREHGSTGIFILDRDGQLVFDDGPHERLHFLARSLALVMRRPGASHGNVHVKIAAGITLEIIPAASADGYLVLGALVSAPLPKESVCKVVEAMAALDPDDRHA